MNVSAANLFHPLRYWCDSPEWFPEIDAADAAADREDSLSERYAFQLGEYQGIHRLKAPVEWPHDAMEKGYSYGLTRQAVHADVYLRKLLGLRLSAFARGLPVSAAITKDYLRQITVTVCPVSGVELTQGTLSDTDWSVDRLENDLGYVPGNICFMSARANRLKGTAGFEKLVEEATGILLQDGPSGYGKDLGGGLLVIEALRLAALAAAPAGHAKGMIGEFIPVAMAPMAWATPRAKIAAVHVASARSRVEGAAQRLRFVWFRRLGKDVWRVSNRLVEEARSFLGRGLHPCDIWLHPDPSLRLVELTDALAGNPPSPPPGMSGEQLLQIVNAGLAPLRDYRRLI